MPELRVQNLYAEMSPTGGPQPLLIDRPGLVQSRSDAGGVTRLVWQRDGVLGDKLLTVVGGRVLLDGVLLGTVAGNGLCRAAAGVGEALLLSDGQLYRLTETSVAAVAFPDGARVADLDFLRGRFVFVREDTGQFYWSDILDGDTIDGLSFATAESQADPLNAIRAIGDELWALGTETVEPYTVSTDPDLPYVPIGGRVFPKGCLSGATVATVDNALFWVSPDRFVYRGGAAVPERVSTHGIEERIAEVPVGDLSAWAFTWRGHSFYVLRAEGSGSWVYDAATGQWAEWKSYNAATWAAWTGQNVDGAVYAGSADDGTLWTLSDDESTDEGAAIERVFTALLPVQSGLVPVDSVELSALAGRAPLGVSPTVEMRQSRDGGFTWGAWRGVSLGSQGNYRARPLWWRNGSADAPGMVFEFRLTDEAPLRVSAVLYNEASRGLAR
jgi:hypothetical protein